MKPEQVRQIVQEEIARSSHASRFEVKSIPFHAHTGTDSSPQIKQQDIIPSISVSGSIKFSQATTYTLYLNSSFTPSNILCTGLVTNGTAKYMFIGTAQLKPSFYFQPNDSTSVVTGNVQYPFLDPNNPDFGSNIPMQSCVYFGVEKSTSPVNAHTLVGNFHMINVAIPTVIARATVTDFSKSSITIVVETLSSGYEIDANILVQ